MTQTPIPFEEIDAAAAERRSDLLMAVARFGADLYLRDFCEMVLASHSRGRPYEASHRQIAATPWGLCCSLSKARKTVERATSAGLVRAEANYAGATQMANRYWIDWQGVSRILRRGQTQAAAAPRMGDGTHERSTADGDRDSGDCLAWEGGEREVAAAAAPHAPTRHPGAPREHGGALSEHGGALRKHPYAPARPRAFELLNTNTNTIPDPVPDPDPDPELKTAANSLAAWRRDSPILAAAESRRLRPLASERLMHGVFAPLTVDVLRSTGQLVAWFRGQLASPSPVLGGSEADLLMVLAAAEYALALPPAKVRTNCVAVFVDCVKRRLWKAIPYVPRARERLDAWLAAADEAGKGEQARAAWEKEGVRLEI